MKMNRAKYTLSPKVSYRVFEDFAVLLDHARSDILRLNRAAGEALRRIESGERPLSDDDLEFAEDLRARGHLLGAADHAAATPDPGLDETRPNDGGVLERINAAAAAARIPLHCQLEVTYRCQLACRHCYIPPGASDPARELSLDEIRALLDRLAELGTLFLLLTGGEPFARKDLRSIFDAARDRRFAVSLLTSGTGADRATLEHMAARGVDSLQVSIFGPDAATHDALTGAAGSFDRALDCLRTSRDLGVRTRAGVTLTRLAEGRLEEIKRLLADEGIPVSLGLYLEPRRDGSRDPQTLAVGEEVLRSALESFPPVDAPRLRKKSVEDPPCGAGANTMGIDPFGEVFPCLSLRQRVGSLRETSVGDLWRISPVLERLRALRVADLEGCPTCPDRGSCNRCVGFAVSEGLGLEDHAPLDCVQARVLTLIEGRGRTSKG